MDEDTSRMDETLLGIRSMVKRGEMTVVEQEESWKRQVRVRRNVGTG